VGVDDIVVVDASIVVVDGATDVVIIVVVGIVVVVAIIVVVGIHPVRIVSRRLQSGHNAQVAFKKQFISVSLLLPYNTHIRLAAGTSGKYTKLNRLFDKFNCFALLGMLMIVSNRLF
jgi:hypothetical protein